MRLLPDLLSRFVKNGHLTVVFEDGLIQSSGSGENGPDVTIRLTDRAVERELFFNPELKAAEAYMDGRMVIDNDGKVYDLLFLFSVNRTGLAAHPAQKALRKVWRAVRRRQQNNKLGLAAKNVQHHYDIPTKFYEAGARHAGGGIDFGLGCARHLSRKVLRRDGLRPSTSRPSSWRRRAFGRSRPGG